MPDEIVRLNHQMTTMRRGIGRLIDSHAEGVIDKAEFEPRIADLKQRLSQLQERHQAALEAAEIERDLSLVISRLEDFSAKVTTRLNALDQVGMQDIIRTLVRRIEIDEGHIEVIFRVPPPDSPPRPPPTGETGSWQHCTGVRRAHARLDQPQPSPCPRLRALRANRRRFRPPRHDPPHAQTIDQANPLPMSHIFPDRLLESAERL